jgi:hypothetical protein
MPDGFDMPRVLIDLAPPSRFFGCISKASQSVTYSAPQPRSFCKDQKGFVGSTNIAG